MDRNAPVLLWFRQDLRLADNPAVAAALGTGAPVVPVFVLDAVAMGDRAYGAASQWWLHHSLTALQRSLAAKGSRLILRRGSWREILPALTAETGARQVHAGRLLEPWARRADTAVAAALGAAGVSIHGHDSALLHDPRAVRTKTGGSYGVYTPFGRAVMAGGPPPPPLPAPDALPPPPRWPASDTLDGWGLLPRAPDWAGGLRQTWTPGEDGAAARIGAFLNAALGSYAQARNTPGVAGTSMLSPHLRWGEISPRQAWHAAQLAAGGSGAGLDTFIKELLWREFAYHLLWHRPDMPDAPLRTEFSRFPFRSDADGLRAWQRGMTGYPIVDAGMRQLWRIGWMHNRVRMITASFLVKHLLLPWQQGERWFWDTLVDADLASNTASWQWVAGSGADAAPYFRIFNPVLQGEKFDPDGAYVRRWVPELAQLPDEFIHKPWEAPDLGLRQAGVTLGTTYPHPIVAHAAARVRALAALSTISRSAA